MDILETLQEKYVPMVEKRGESIPADIVFFGGDQLTEEWARNIQKARMDGDTVQERLEGVWPKNEDWHGIRIAYQVTILSCLVIHANLHAVLHACRRVGCVT